MRKLISSITASCLIVSVLCKPAAAGQIPLPTEQWQAVSRDATNNNIVSYDQGTITRQGNFASFWIQINHSTGNVAISRIYAAGDCSSGAFKPVWVAQANRQGKIVANEQANQPITTASPGSSIGMILNAICGSQNPAVQTQSDQARITQAQLEALTRRSQATSDAISEAMRSAASLFK